MGGCIYPSSFNYTNKIIVVIEEKEKEKEGEEIKEYNSISSYNDRIISDIGFRKGLNDLLEKENNKK